MGERRQVLVDTVAASVAVGVTVGRIENWRRRGDLVPVEQGTAGRGKKRNMYLLRDVRRVYREKTSRAHSVDTRGQN